MADDNDDEIEDAAEAFFKDSGPGPNEMANEYIPKEEDWLAKTLLDVSDPAAIAALRNFETIYPEVSDLQPLVDGALDEFLKGKTSVGGRSREEYRKILMAMFGQSDDDTSDSIALQAVAPEED